MADLEKEIMLDDLDEKNRELAEIIGLENLLKLSKYYGGDTIYVNKYDEIIKDARDRMIKCEYRGYNSKQLANKYNLTKRRVQQLVESEETARHRIVRGKIEAFLNDNQISLFDK